MLDRTATDSDGEEYLPVDGVVRSFMMESPEDDTGRDYDETQHQVTLTREYYIQTTEVTQGQWETVMGNNPLWLKKCKAEMKDAKIFH